MPIYTFRDKNTNEEFDIMMSYKDLESYAEANPDHERVYYAPAIVSGVSVTNKVASGFKDVLSKISDAHPDSPLASNHRSRSVKEVQTQRAIQKWKGSTG